MTNLHKIPEFYGNCIKSWEPQQIFDAGIYHILYNRCWSKELEAERGNQQKAEAMPSFKAFETKTLRTLAENPVCKLIFDLRMNGGGDSQQGTSYIEILADYLNKLEKRNRPRIRMGKQTMTCPLLFFGKIHVKI